MSELFPILIALPCVGAVILLCAGRLGLGSPRWTALLVTTLTCGFSCWVAYTFDPAQAVTESESPLRQFGIFSAFEVNGLNLWLLVLTSLLSFSAVLISWESIQIRPANFYALLLLIESGVLGVFSATNIIWLLICLETTRIAFFFLIGIWGGGERRDAAVKYFLYTLVGGGLLFLGFALLVMSHQRMSDDSQLVLSLPTLIEEIPRLAAANSQNVQFWAGVKMWIFVSLCAGFAIHVPLFPLHTWLHGADVEAPAAGSLLLTGIWLKIGAYGVLRFLLPLFPELCWEYAEWLRVLAAIGVIYGVMLALVQDDLKQLAMNLTISFMNFSLLGLLTFNLSGISGGILLLCAHGLAIGIVICLTGMLFERYRTYETEAYGGLMAKFPRLAILMTLAAFSLSAIPLTAGFAATIVTFLGIAEVGRGYAIVTLVGLVFWTWCLLRVMQSLFLGKFREPVLEHRAWTSPQQTDSVFRGDLRLRELAAVLPLAVAVLGIGVAPQFFLDRMQPAVQQVIDRLEQAQPASNVPAEAGDDEL